MSTTPQTSPLSDLAPMPGTRELGVAAAALRVAVIALEAVVETHPGRPLALTNALDDTRRALAKAESAHHRAALSVAPMRVGDTVTFVGSRAPVTRTGALSRVTETRFVVALTSGGTVQLDRATAEVVGGDAGGRRVCRVDVHRLIRDFPVSP